MEGQSHFGLAALGKAGEFTVEVLSRQESGWLLTVESPTWCFAFDLACSSSVSRLSDFLQAHAGHEEFAEMVVGSFGGLAVRVIKDDEFQDRFFLRASGSGFLADFTLAGGSERDFAEAVAQAAEEFGVESGAGAVV